MSNSAKSVSFVIPCLNEQVTLPSVLTKIRKLCQSELADRQTEIIVSDNGSTDNSIKIAQEHGAKVIHCAEKGYGAALLSGITGAAGEIVIFADADNTYDFLESPSLIRELEKGFDLVIGSRLKGNIHPGAMPFLHRYFGTPVLNSLINLLYASSDNKITDCNSGFRCFKRDSFLSWGVKSKGMEFASEMLIKALKSNAKISNVPVSLYPDTGQRTPHLKKWRDGMRHVLQIFLDSPKFFFVTGIAMFCLSWLVLIIGMFFGPISIGFASIFGLHSMMFGLLGSFFGIIIWAMGLFLAVKIKTDIKIYRYLIDLSEDKLFWYSIILVLASLTLFLAIVIYWAFKGFRFISIEKETLVIVAFASNSVLLVFNIITTQLLKRF
jgi:glycosyltransferase involved in cell wall biosynthesis